MFQLICTELYAAICSWQFRSAKSSTALGLMRPLKEAQLARPHKTCGVAQVRLGRCFIGVNLAVTCGAMASIVCSADQLWASTKICTSMAHSLQCTSSFTPSALCADLQLQRRPGGLKWSLHRRAQVRSLSSSSSLGNVCNAPTRALTRCDCSKQSA